MRPNVPAVTRSPVPSPAMSSAQPAAVAVHWADGGRCVPISRGKRNWRSAVQKWLEAAQSAFCSWPPLMSAAASTSPSTNVEQAP